MRIGFIGLGNIGKPMAKHLTDKEFELQVFDVFEDPVQELTKLGATAVAPKEMAEQCDIIGICVRDNSDVESLLYEQGMLEAATANTIFAIHSTVTRQGLEQWAQDASDSGVHLIDAPITGGAQGAEDGSLIYMLGGRKEIVERCMPIFNHSAKSIVHAGDLGTGIVLKLAINSMTYSAFIAIKEATELAKAAGLDPAVLYEVGQGNGVVTPFSHRFASGREQALQAVDDETLVSIFEPMGRLGEKDLDAALQTAAGLGIDMPNAENSRKLIMDTFVKRTT